MLAIFPLFLVLGFFAPGCFLAKSFDDRLWWASAFPLSLVILFHAVFWTGVFGVPIQLWTIAPIVTAVICVFAWLERRRPKTQKIKAEPWTRLERVLLVLSALIALALLGHSISAPLMGVDTRFRWDFLAQKLFTLGRFDFYPPVSAADFKVYFYVDGIPPMVSIANWWVYASAGSYLPALTSIFVAAQFAGTLVFTYGAAAAIFSRRAAVLAVAILAGAPLFFRSVVIGQETGLTALAMAATIYLLVSGPETKTTGRLMAAGMAASLCALSREYGWMAVVAGAIILLWRRREWRPALLFCASAAIAAGPWYVRNWIRTGNPLYSLQLLNFTVNPIHVRFLEYYKTSMGLQNWTAGNWISVTLLMLTLTILPVMAGVPGGIRRFREHGYLLVTALLFAALWVQSIGYTSAGVENSMRVLSPMLPPLAIAAAGFLDALSSRPRWSMAIVTMVVLCQVWAVAAGVFLPENPLSVSLSQWTERAFPRIAEAADFQMAGALESVLPPGKRVLSDNAYLHAALQSRGIEVVPVWSPEVRFLFSAPAEEADRRLRELGIGSVAIYPQTMNLTFLASASPFYATLPQRWKVLGHSANYMYVLAPGSEGDRSQK